MAAQSKLPAGETLSKPMTAYLQNECENRQISNTTPIDLAATLPEVIARLNALLNDLS